MKKVGIVTIESENWGNRLQNYALQIVIESLGFNVETINRHYHKKLSVKLQEKIKKIIKIIIRAKSAKIYEFDKLINKSKHYAGKDEAEKNIDTYYDYFVAGSDQLWNPYFPFVGKCDLLTFARNEQKISYAASFGIDHLPESKIELYSEALKNFTNISVRENSAVDLVHELTGKKAEVVLDPTLMLEGEEWRKIEKKPSGCPNKKYCLIYFIGEKSQDSMDEISKMHEEEDWEFFDIRQKNILGLERYIGPAEFLYLIDHAEMILTDSFHAVVFSILFHKNVKNYRRKDIDMSSRIVTLSEMVGLKDNIVNNIFSIDQNVDFEKVDLLLEKERNKSMEFLKKALKCE